MVVGSLFWADLETIKVLYQRCIKITKTHQEDQTPYNSDMKDWPLQPTIEFINFTLKYRHETKLFCTIFPLRNKQTKRLELLIEQELENQLYVKL